MAQFGYIRDRIATLPRVKLALTPTPLHEAPRLSAALGGPRIFLKRDDLTGVAFGGNKLRNLEFRLAHALAERPDTIIVGLDLQSNSARQTAGRATSWGWPACWCWKARCRAVQGNLLVDYLMAPR